MMRREAVHTETPESLCYGKMTDYSGKKKAETDFLVGERRLAGACTYKDHIYFAYTEGWDELWEILWD